MSKSYEYEGPLTGDRAAAPVEPKVAEPQCTGPFSDARDCPVHSKDIPPQLTSRDLYEAYLLGCEDECIPEPKTFERFMEVWNVQSTRRTC